MFAGCLKISQYRETLPRPGQALSWHLRPADRRVTTTGYCYNLQSSIPWTIAVLWCPASSLTVIKARHKDLEWRGDTGKLGSQQSRRQEFLCFNSPVNCTDGRDFLISTDARLLSLIGHLLGLKAPNSWMMRWSGDLNVVSFGACVLNKSVICNTARPGTALLAIDCMLAVSRHLLVSAVCRDPGIWYRNQIQISNSVWTLIVFWIGSYQCSTTSYRLSPVTNVAWSIHPNS